MLPWKMRTSIVCLFVALAFASCEKVIMPETKSKKPSAVFEELWSTLDEGYSLFDQKKLRWDSVHMKFQPLIYDSMTSRQLYDTVYKMLVKLNDPHVVLNAGFTQTNFDNRYKYPANFDRLLLERNYWKNCEKTGPFIHTIIDSIGYVYYESFDQEVTEEQLNLVIERFRNVNLKKGTIIDIRGNKGGNINNAFTILSKIDIPDELLNTTTLLYSIAYKNGPKHDQFTKTQDNWLKESEGDKFVGDVVILTNRDNRGTAALFASGGKSFANAKVMGDTTMGYSGPLSGYELSNGWTIHYPSALVFTADGRSMMNGVPPNEVVQMKPDEIAQGKDAILEAALVELNKE